jgi:hypothetical protein
MSSKDYIPRNDEDFDILQNNVYTTASTKYSAWDIPMTRISELSQARARWTAAITAYRNIGTRTPAVIQEKNDARKAYEVVLRNFIQGQLMHNSKVSDADHRFMGLPVYDRTPTTPSKPASRTEMEIYFAQIMQHKIQVHDSETKSAAKPEHIIGFELWRKIGGDTEPSIEDMQLVELATRSPHVLEYASADRGKNVWYSSRWVNTRGEKGPWSETVSAIVP